jgi:hypothetical protein
MAMVYEWTTRYCEYNFEDPANPSGNVFVTILHWNCRARDDAIAGDQWVSRYGTVDASDQNRVYTLPALSNVPESVMTGWVQQALDKAPAEEQTSVADIEAALLTDWNNLQQPASGGLSPGA